MAAEGQNLAVACAKAAEEILAEDVTRPLRMNMGVLVWNSERAGIKLSNSSPFVNLQIVMPRLRLPENPLFMPTITFLVKRSKNSAGGWFSSVGPLCCWSSLFCSDFVSFQSNLI